MHEEYSKKIDNTGAYLERIGLAGEKIPLTKAGLDKLVYAHLFTVPFENLDIYDDDMQVDLNIDALYDKIVVRRRGGYCFEQNALFMSLLESLGFEAYAVAARILRPDKILRPFSHRANIVTINGERFMCDVGYGGPICCSAISIDNESPQEVYGSVFTVEQYDERNKLIVRHKDGEKEPLFLFAPVPFYTQDFIPLSFYISGMPESYFRVKRMVNLRAPDGSISIDGDIFREHHAGTVTETELKTKEELETVLREKFGVVFEIKKPV